MIPLKLQIKNFLSYGPEIQTIDFSPYQLICLSGKNGHGKSALLDAITWALWGQARKIPNSSKADQGLLHLGQTLMMVTLDFECNRQRYRIKREYAQTYGKPYALLEFGIISDESDTVIPLTDKTIRATQHKIEQTLHLDFDSFINSAFLRQGQSNEFSKKSPKDRKEILASILGLNRYEKIKRLSLEKTKYALAQKNSLITLEQKYLQDLQSSASIDEQLRLLTSAIAELNMQEQSLSEQQRELEAKKNILQERQKEAAVVEMKRLQTSSQQNELRSELMQLRSLWRTINKQRAADFNYQELENKKTELSTQLTAHQKEIQRLFVLKEELFITKEKLSAIEQKALSEHTTRSHLIKNNLQNAVNEYQQNQKNIQERNKLQENLLHEKNALEKIKESVGIDLLKITAELVDQAGIEKQFERRKEFYHRFIAQGNALKKELEELEQKKQLVQEEDDPSCPLCEQNLSASRKRFLKNKFEDHHRFLTHRIERLTLIIKRLKELLITQHSLLEKNKKNVDAIHLLQLKLDEIEKNFNKTMTETEKIVLEIHSLQAQHHQLETTKNKLQQEYDRCAIFDKKELLQNEEYLQLQTELAQKEDETKKLSFHTQKQEEIIVGLREIEKEIDRLESMKVQLAQQGQRAQDILSLCAKLKQIKQVLRDLEHEQKQFAHIRQEETEVLSKHQQIQESTQALKLVKEQKMQEKGRIDAQKAQLTSLEKESKAIQKNVIDLSTLIDEYQTIAQATGKDGIQALLIEDAIPEIEQEANHLLAKLTDNQAQIYIESLRDLKKGGTKETLDIKISDTIGIRPYELFSGGEAFRIDFALRIAISKLLARRAGTALQTLIIDEGFGSQDEDGLNHIMEAIYKIQEDFAKVIIVSHLPSMKDQFPVHFVIDKGNQGSTIKVVEQG